MKDEKINRSHSILHSFVLAVSLQMTEHFIKHLEKNRKNGAFPFFLLVYWPIQDKYWMNYIEQQAVRARVCLGHMEVREALEVGTLGESVSVLGGREGVCSWTFHGALSLP